mmetsp:Transcript_54319/g.87946  ORF Transcript_54319/g.87946 Transcript_54319/m.87946 type:complete len:81 (-) Transcript_54319:64-306(-)
MSHVTFRARTGVRRVYVCVCWCMCVFGVCENACLGTNSETPRSSLEFGVCSLSLMTARKSSYDVSAQMYEQKYIQPLEAA